MDFGQSQTFNSTVCGGTPPYNYQWYLVYMNMVSSVHGATESTLTFSQYVSGVSGSFTVYLKVTDKVGANATSNNATITVNNPLSVTISSVSVGIYGQYQIFTSNVTGGASPYAYSWYINNTLVSGITGATWTFTPSCAGSYSVYAEVTDAVGVTATSNTATFTVMAAGEGGGLYRPPLGN
jgi:hypothetical protein